MPGGYGTDDSTPWGAAGTSYVSPGQTSSPYQSGGGSTNQGGSNDLADAINIANAAPPQISASQNLQNQANIAIGCGWFGSGFNNASILSTSNA